MSTFRLPAWLHGEQEREPTPSEFPGAHVRVLRDGADLQLAADQALEFETAAVQALQARIERYAELGAPPVITLPEATPPADASSSGADAESRPTTARGDEDAGSDDGISVQERFFTPSSGVA